ncbi:MAG: CopG family transcriptional regulator [Candidatus Omnitrophota bacterium]
MKKSNRKKITSEEFDKRFDNGEDMGGFLNIRKAEVNKHARRINIDFPLSFLKRIEKEARRIGVARTALIKIWIAERLEHIQHQ